MKILIASVDALPQIGGISLMGHYLANAFVRLGHEVVFLGPRGSFVPSGFQRYYLLCEDWGSSVRKREGSDGLEQDERIRELGALIFERYGIERLVLLHPFYYAIALMDLARARGIETSLFFHGFELRSQLHGEYPRAQADLVKERKIGTLRERLFYSIGVADELLVNSAYTSSLIEPFSVRPEIRITGCGIEDEVAARELVFSPNYDPEERAARRRALGLSRLPTLAFVGRLVSTKCAERLVQLCRHNSGLAAVIMGEGKELPRLEALVQRYGLTERVRIVGVVSEDEKWEFLRAADCLCLLSEPNEKDGQVEGFGIALLEGAAAGALPVSSGTGGMRDVVQDGKTGVIAGEDDRAFAKHLASLLADPESMKKMVEGAREQLNERYTWQKVASAMLQRWQGVS